MKRRDLILELSARIPGWLKALRGRMVLEGCLENLGVQEAQCPGCGGSGWLDERRLESCPVCRGFREVPRSLAGWLDGELLKLRHRRRMQSLPRCTCPPEPEGARYGLCAELVHRVSEPDPGAGADL